jgi:hypothetical protein
MRLPDKSCNTFLTFLQSFLNDPPVFLRRFQLRIWGYFAFKIAFSALTGIVSGLALVVRIKIQNQILMISFIYRFKKLLTTFV